MNRPKGGMGRGLGALGLGTAARPYQVPETQEFPGKVPPSNGNHSNRSAYPVTTSYKLDETGRGEGKMGMTTVPLTSIGPNPWQPRKHIDPVILEELASSIREHGLLQPPVVSYNPDYTSNFSRDSEETSNGTVTKEPPVRFLLIAGERRWQAAKLAGLTSIPVVIKESTPIQMLELALVENIQRADLNPLEEAHAYRQLVTEFGLTQENVSKRVGKSRVSVTNSLRLLTLPSTVIEAITEGKITEGHARAILMLERLPEEKRLSAQLRLLREIISKGDRLLSVRETEELARRILGLNSVALLDTEIQELVPVKIDQKALNVTNRATHELEARLRDALGAKVELSRSKKGGKIVIQFSNEGELEKIYKRILDSGI